MLQAVICPVMAATAVPPGCTLESYKDANGCNMGRVICPESKTALPTSALPAASMEQYSAKRRWTTIAVVLLGGTGLLLGSAYFRRRRSS